MYSSKRLTSSNVGASQKGAALIVALLISAIIATLSTIIVYQQRIRIKQASEMLAVDKASLSLNSIAMRASDYLVAQANDSVGSKGVGAKFQFKIPYSDLNTNNIQVDSILEDEHALYNINLLLDRKNINTFISLLLEVIPDIQYSQAAGIANQIIAYQQSIANYQESKLGFSNIREIMLVPSITEDIYNYLAPYITAFPDSKSKINLNTVIPEVLSVVYPGLNQGQLDQLVSCRDNYAPFASSSDWGQQCGDLVKGASAELPIGFSSEYYQLRAVLTVDGDSFLLQSLLLMSNDNAKNKQLGDNSSQATLLWQVYL